MTVMRVSPRGVIQLICEEGIVPYPYLDSKGVWTYGIGHTAGAGAPFPAKMAKGAATTLTAVVKLFRQDLVKYENDVNKALKVKVAQHEFDAIVGWHYNPATAIWSPPPGLVEISAMVWWHTTFAPMSATQPNAACIKVWKNGFGVELKAAPGYTPSGYPNTAGAALPAFIDLCEEGDYYSLWAYGTSMNGANDLIIDGHHAHSWWCGKAFSL